MHWLQKIFSFFHICWLTKFWFPKVLQFAIRWRDGIEDVAEGGSLFVSHRAAPGAPVSRRSQQAWCLVLVSAGSEMWFISHRVDWPWRGLSHANLPMRDLFMGSNLSSGVEIDRWWNWTTTTKSWAVLSGRWKMVLSSLVPRRSSLHPGEVLETS